VAMSIKQRRSISFNKMESCRSMYGTQKERGRKPVEELDL
jgi:hypothetical protein